MREGGARGQNHRNSISRSGGDDPTFRQSLRKRALRLAAHTPLPPVGLPTHTKALTAVHVHIIAQRLRRVNHFLRPWAAGPAWTQTTLCFSNCLRFSRPLSSWTFIWTLFPPVLVRIPAALPASFGTVLQSRRERFPQKDLQRGGHCKQNKPF